MVKDFIIFVMVNLNLEIMLEDVCEVGVSVIGMGCFDFLN